jgi:hypothetical protein
MTLFELHPSLWRGLGPQLDRAVWPLSRETIADLRARDCDWFHQTHSSGSVTMVIDKASGE